MSYGVDLSKWNVVSDFKALAESVEFVLLRVAASTSKDISFDYFVENCKKNNVPIIGVYLFSYALTCADAASEADHAVQYVEAAGLKDAIIFFDYEYDSLNYAKKHGVVPTKKMVTDFTDVFCGRVKVLGHKSGVYCNVDFKNNWYEKGFLDKYPLWLADWRKDRVYTGDEVLIHQYSSTGKVPGLVGPVDLNHYYPEEVKMEVDESDPITMLARQVIDGKWGNGLVRKQRLLSAIQNRVNELLKK